jgi:hypothetical protein
MADQSGMHGPAQDDFLAREARREQRPEGDTHRRGLAPGLSEGARESRSEIARFLGISAFPADREGLVTVAAGNDAPDEVIARLRHLPAGERFRNVEDVIEALGLHGESRRG